MQKEQLNRFTSILAALLFAMSALSFLKDGQLSYAFILLIISLLNIIALIYFKERKRTANIILNFLNAIAAGVTTYDYIQKETDYIHYVWMLTTIMFLAVTVYFIFKKEPIRLRKK